MLHIIFKMKVISTLQHFIINNEILARCFLSANENIRESLCQGEESSSKRTELGS